MVVTTLCLILLRSFCHQVSRSPQTEAGYDRLTVDPHNKSTTFRERDTHPENRRVSCLQVRGSSVVSLFGGGQMTTD